MARQIDKLSAIGLKHRSAGRHHDGRGLYLAVSDTGARSWVFRWKQDGKAHQIGLGSLKDVSLADARAKRDEQRKLIQDDKQPQGARARRGERIAAARKSQTFGQVAEAVLASKSLEFRNAKHK